MLERALAAMLFGGLGTLMFGELLSSQPALIISTATIVLVDALHILSNSIQENLQPTLETKSRQKTTTCQSVSIKSQLYVEFQQYLRTQQGANQSRSRAP